MARTFRQPSTMRLSGTRCKTPVLPVIAQVAQHKGESEVIYNSLRNLKVERTRFYAENKIKYGMCTDYFSTTEKKIG